MEYFWNMIKNVLGSFGFYQKSGKLLFLGLDDAGKTTFLNLVKSNTLIQPIPSQHGTCEELTLGNMKFTTYDLGGHKQVRRLWKDYFFAVDAIVFIIDVSKTDRFSEAKTELDAIIDSEQMNECPIVVIGNKIDKQTEINEEYIRAYFNLATTGKEKNRNQSNDRPLEIFMCSLKYRQGYGEALRWLSQYFD